MGSNKDKIDISERAEKYREYLDNERSKSGGDEDKNESSEREKSLSKESDSELDKPISNKVWRNLSVLRHWKVISVFFLFGIASLTVYSVDINSTNGLYSVENNTTERSITEVRVEDQNLDPVRPTISTEEKVRFVNQEEYDIEISFENDDQNEVISPGDHVEKNLDGITYYSVSNADVAYSREIYGSINVQ